MSVLAERLGIKRSSTYANWEYGIRDPDTETLVKLAQVFEVT
ncbi:helix-turn-helix domain-containing protein [Paenibacillus sp. MZ04-78.2]|nr:helix-turn-helix transcriptional regulator [Paenibacillus sp. MZ04-78.2]MCP3773039.1 helix-turn-helix domain-containing protein [Paenibacillus sp. MZ04-78.2]